MNKYKVGTAAVVVAIACGTAQAQVSADPSVLPGYWHSVNRSSFLVTKTTEDKRCLTAAQVKAFMTNPSNKHYTCDYATRDVTDGKIRLHGTCVDKKGLTVQIDASGEYGSDWFKLDARWSLNGLPVGGTASTTARRIAAVCPVADAATPGSSGLPNISSR